MFYKETPVPRLILNFQMDFIVQIHLKSKSMSRSKSIMFLDFAISPCHEVTTGGSHQSFVHQGDYCKHLVLELCALVMWTSQGVIWLRADKN